MKIELTKNATKQLSSLQKTEAKKVIKKLLLLTEFPHSGKKLEGDLKNKYSMRAWPFRIIYNLDNSKITVESIEHRQGVYKK